MRKSQLLFILLLIPLLLLLLNGCGGVERNSHSDNLTPLTSLPTSMRTATSTLKPKPSPTAYSTTTLTYTPTHISTVVPTLPREQAQLLLFDLLMKNGNCTLPCLWSITPGKSSYDDAFNVLMPLLDLSDYSHLNPQKTLGDIGLIIVENSIELHTRVAFVTHPGTNINSIFFQARALKRTQGGFEGVFNAPIFGKRFEYYSLASVLRRHGPPSSVMISTLAKIPYFEGVEGFEAFELLLLYPEQGILVDYTSEMNVVGENIQGCFSNAHVQFELLPAGNADLFYELLAPTYWPEFIRDQYKSIDQVTSLTSEEFYHAFSDSTSECILTPASYWPVPDQYKE